MKRRSGPGPVAARRALDRDIVDFTSVTLWAPGLYQSNVTLRSQRWVPFKHGERFDWNGDDPVLNLPGEVWSVVQHLFHVLQAALLFNLRGYSARSFFLVVPTVPHPELLSLSIISSL